MITAVTLTGDRQETFELCKQWMEEQTVQPEQWLVIDDGKKPTDPPKVAQYVRREPKKGEPEHSLIMNMRIALPLIKGDMIIIFEDDEYYAPGYIEAMAEKLEDYEVVGICPSRYYHLFSSRYMACGNTEHASFAQTAFRSSFLPEVEKMLKGSPFIDGKIWELMQGKNGRSLLFSDAREPLYVAMKGMMGRGGVGNGHKNINDQTPDSRDRKMLRKWIPNERHFDIYAAISNKYKMEGKVFMGKYKAKVRGYIPHLGLIEAGQEFEYTGEPGPWMIPVEEKLTVPPEPALAPEANTMSEMTKAFAEKKGIIPPPTGSNNRIPRPGETTASVPLETKVKKR
jgi:glycosyltransferase involved in cell wall biosynthesis